jgi:hypothetical protein
MGGPGFDSIALQKSWQTKKRTGIRKVFLLTMSFAMIEITARSYNLLGSCEKA